MNRTSARLLAATVCVAVGTAAISFGKKVPDRPAASVLEARSRASTAERWRTVTDTVRKGEPLVTALERAGVEHTEATLALRSASSIDDKKIRTGMAITARTNPDSGASEIVFHMAIDRLVRLRRSGDAEWTESEEVLPWIVDTVAVGGNVQSTLTDAIVRGADAFPSGNREKLAYALASILEYRVDMSRDLQRNDTVLVLLERRTAPNGITVPGRILAARLTVSGRRVETVRFESAKSDVQYFDGDGKTMRAAFLRSPLELSRITSKFGMRKHPILGVWRAHQGLDYGANRGAPIRSIGDGTVIFAGTKGGYGRTVEIRHRNGMVTRYGHMNGFAKGVKRGASVKISSTIGYVGSSGLATAPHLHFEVLIGGVHKDPRSALKNQSGEPMAVADRGAFTQLKSQLFTLLERLIDDASVVAQDRAAGSVTGVRGVAARHAGDD